VTPPAPHYATLIFQPDNLTKPIRVYVPRVATLARLLGRTRSQELARRHAITLARLGGYLQAAGHTPPTPFGWKPNGAPTGGWWDVFKAEGILPALRSRLVGSRSRLRVQHVMVDRPTIVCDYTPLSPQT
jgi:hypothetical protein